MLGTTLRDGLTALSDGRPHPGVVTGQVPLDPADTGPGRGAVLVFPGQGSAWVGMGRGLLECSPVFAGAVMWAVYLALARLWESVGVVPSAVVALHLRAPAWSAPLAAATGLALPATVVFDDPTPRPPAAYLSTELCGPAAAGDDLLDLIDREFEPLP